MVVVVVALVRHQCVDLNGSLTPYCDEFLHQIQLQKAMQSEELMFIIVETSGVLLGAFSVIVALPQDRDIGVADVSTCSVAAGNGRGYDV